MRHVRYPGHVSLSTVWSCPYIANYRCTEGALVQNFPPSSIYACFRNCRPERYEIRGEIHAALVSHTTALSRIVSRPVDAVSSQGLPLSDVAQGLTTLVRLFDEILLEEYCEDHGSLDSAEVQQGHSTCSFCGSCLFLSSFLCRRCSQETAGPALICAGCYIEGRSCQCDAMNPVRLGDFLGALRDRNDAINSLYKASHLHHVPVEGLVEGSER